MGCAPDVGLVDGRTLHRGVVPRLDQDVVDVELERLFVLGQEGEIEGDAAVVQEAALDRQHGVALLHKPRIDRRVS